MASVPKSNSAQEARSAFYKSLEPHNLAPLWEVLRGLVTPQPTTPAVPAHWRYADVRPYLFEAGDLITAAEAERRVLILENPALPAQSRITSTLYAGLQLILPGEVAPCHRHTQSALRFVMEGSGAFTAVNGERVHMQQYDLVLTPNWIWHDHGNETGEPMVWLDGLDIPLVTALDASFAEHLESRGAHAATRPSGDALARYGRNLRPVQRQTATRTPLFAYPFSDWRDALDRVSKAGEPDPHDGFRMEFTNPSDAGPVMNTISAFCQLVPAGMATLPHRSTDGTIFVVVQGSGQARIGAETYALSEGDIFVAPSWSRRTLSAQSDLVLFSYSDGAAQEKLGLWREAVEADDV